MAAKKRSDFPPLWLSIGLLLGWVAAAALLTFDFGIGQEKGPIVTQAMICLTPIALLLWFCLFSAASMTARLWTGAVALGGLAFSLIYFEIRGVSFDMWVELGPRFGKRPDQLLAKPETTGRQIDLATTTPQDFPRFFGKQGNGVVHGVKLERDWDAHPPREIWRREIGAGWSGFAVVNGYAVTMEQRDADEMITCYHVESGDIEWEYSIAARYQTRLGGVGPRCTPAIDDGRVYAIGAFGRLTCLDGANGTLVWEQDLPEFYGVSLDDEQSNLMYGRSNSPLVVDDLVVVPAGGGGPYVSLVAFDKNTGEKKWDAGDDFISYASPVVSELHDVRQIVSVNERTVTGHDIASGEILWSFDWPGRSNTGPNVANAQVISPDLVFVSKYYGGGGKLMEIVDDGGGNFSAAERWHEPKVMQTKYTNPVIHEGYVYGLSDGVLECIELESGDSMWRERDVGNFGGGQLLLVGDLLLVLSDEGRMSLIEANPDEPVILGSEQMLEGKTWNNFALFGRHLLVRNAEWAACYALMTDEATE